MLDSLTRSPHNAFHVRLKIKNVYKHKYKIHKKFGIFMYNLLALCLVQKIPQNLFIPRNVRILCMQTIDI
jgi:hypothetical protein